MSIVISRFLRHALRVDAIGCALFAVGALAVLLGPTSFRDQLGVPAELLLSAGIIALTGLPVFWWMSCRPRVSQMSVWIILLTNTAWAIASCLALISGCVHTSTLGAIVVVTQGVLVGIIGGLEYIGLHRSRAMNG